MLQQAKAGTKKQKKAVLLLNMEMLKENVESLQNLLNKHKDWNRTEYM